MISDLQPGDFVDGYRIIRPLGRGGMGVVFEAEHVRLGRRVAFKVLQAERAHDPAFHERFEREARLAARLDHPNVVAVHDAGVADGRPWIAMALIDGEDLRSRLRRSHERLDLRLAVDVVVQVGAALDHAHGKGVLHRDVKPANVFLSDDGGRIIARLGDFGLTKEVDAGDELTASGMVVGSVDYLAPEVLEQRPVGVRSDVYALAATLLTAMTGAPPFSGGTAARMAAHGSAPRPRPSERRPELGPFDAVMLRGLAVDPDDRYPSAGALAAAASDALRIATGGGPADGASARPSAAPDDDFEIVLRSSRVAPAPGAPPPAGPSGPAGPP
ncbi:serine/threonine-protein kinase, partial [Patulibacter sp. NPDC049589]|uniref:serine/threonine-protein kinase n=1 Tax=Patulibacter sp. NPDC049589 TaxID=3154731 RepID=UPI0034219E06